MEEPTTPVTEPEKQEPRAGTRGHPIHPELYPPLTPEPESDITE